MTFTLIGSVVFAAVLYGWYATIISRRNSALEALSGIDVQLKKRSNLIPNILTIAKRFMDHERGLLEEITSLRTKLEQTYDPKNAEAVREHFATAGQLSKRMGGIMVQVEAYPDMKSNQTMITAMETYNEVEALIAAARRFYNSATASLNTAAQIFPGNLLAAMANVQQMPFYQAEEDDRAPVNAVDYLD